MEEEALSIERRLSGRDTEPKGTVRVTSLESFSTYFLANRLGEFCERFPQIELDLYTDSRSLNLSRREADIALRMAKPTQEGLITKKIATIGYALYGAKEGKSGRFLGYSEELSTIPEYRWLKERSPEGFAMRSNSVGVLAKASSKGAGLAVLPCFVGDLEQGLRRVEPPREVLSRELWLIVHPELQGRRDIRAVMSFISEVVTAAKGMLAG
jgi:DNA-binding transcriptional LysR family regulator